jgi:endonuclease/exonuclease/phosphatase family metal-dependent hydrolase
VIIISSLIQTLVPFFVSLSAPTVAEDSGSVKVSTYNIQNGLDTYTIDLLAELAADILALQEVYEIFYHGSEINMSQLASSLSYPYYASPTNYNQRLYGLVILSKFEIIKSSFVELSGPSYTTPRGLLIADINKNNTTVRVITTHLDLPWLCLTRFSQAKTLLAQINDSIPVVVLGDFNTPNSIFDLTYWRLFTNLHDTWIVSGNPPFTGKTWPVEFSLLRVDYIFVNDYCTTVRESAELITDVQSSDHRGLSVRLLI